MKYILGMILIIFIVSLSFLTMNSSQGSDITNYDYEYSNNKYIKIGSYLEYGKSDPVLSHPDFISALWLTSDIINAMIITGQVNALVVHYRNNLIAKAVIESRNVGDLQSQDSQQIFLELVNHYIIKAEEIVNSGKLQRHYPIR